MTRPNQPSRRESSMLAAALAAAGTLFMSDKLSSVAHHSGLAFPIVLQTAGIVMVAVGICLLLVEWPAARSSR